MQLPEKHRWLLGFSAVFALLVGFVFWGTWSLGVAPIMPDCAVTYPPDYVKAFLRGWLGSGRFVPGDLIVFLGSPYFWTELKYALALYCAALGMVYFLRGRGLGCFASYGAGLLLAFSGYWMTLFSAGHLGWFQWMTYGVFAFGLTDRAVRIGKFRHWALLGAVLAWGSFYQPDLWLLFTVFTFAYFVRCHIREHKLPEWKGCLIALVFFVGIGLPSFRNALVNDLAGRDKQIESGATIGADVKDDDARWVFVTNWSLPVDETAEFMFPRINGDTSCPFTLALGGRAGSGVKPYTGALGRPLGAREGNYRQHSLYVGFVTCILAIFGIVFNRRKGEVVFFAVCALVFWLFSLGRNFEVVYRIVYALPFGDYLRAPVKWHHLTEFAIVVLAGYGIEALSGLRDVKWLRWALPALVLVGAVDLARIDRLYLAPQDVTKQYTFIGRDQLADQRVVEYLKKQGGAIAGRVGSLACISLPREKPPASESELTMTFGAVNAMASVSVLMTLLALGIALKGSRR